MLLFFTDRLLVFKVLRKLRVWKLQYRINFGSKNQKQFDRYLYITHDTVYLQLLIIRMVQSTKQVIYRLKIITVILVCISQSLILAQNNNVFLQTTTVKILYFLVIDSLEHEVLYWDSLNNSTTKRGRLTKVACASFRDILIPLASDFR